MTVMRKKKEKRNIARMTMTKDREWEKSAKDETDRKEKEKKWDPREDGE